MSRFNGQASEYIRWLIGVAAAGIVAYFTTISAIQAEVTAIKTRQDAQFQEVLRRLDVMQTDIRELRGR